MNINMKIKQIPSKALLNSSHMYYHAKKDFAAHGISGAEGLEVDVKKMQAGKNKSVKALTGGIEFLFKKYVNYGLRCMFRRLFLCHVVAIIHYYLRIRKP